ncbi:MAG: LysR family transcriptional regulator [Acidimicrobiales bacterium]
MPIDPRVSLQKLEIFDTVVRLGGVGRAADHLGVAQPVVSGHLRSLEKRLNAKLFYRSGTHLHLTAAGRAVHLWALDVLRQTRELSRDLDSVRRGVEGSVVVAASMTVGSYRLPPMLSAFLLDRPGVDIRMDIIDAAHAIAGTEAGVNDFSVVVVAAPPDNPALHAEQVGSEDLILVSSRDGPPRGEGPFEVSELSSLPFVEAQSGSLRRQFTDQVLGDIGLGGRRVVMELGHPEAMKQVVTSGLGVSWLFRNSVRTELHTGALRQVVVAGVAIGGPMYLIRRRDRTLSALHNELLAEMRTFLAADA